MKSIISLFIVILPSLLGCSEHNRSKPLSTRIAVSLTPLSAPLFIAQEKKIFEKCGLDIDFIEVKGGKRAYEKLKQGEVEFATSSDSVASYNALSGDKFNIITAFASSDNDTKILIAKDYRDNKNYPLRVGYWPSSASEHLLQNFIQLSGLDNNVVPFELSPEHLGQGILDGSLDIISIWEPFIWQVLEADNRNKVQLINTAGILSLNFALLGTPNIPAEKTLSEKILASLYLATLEISSDEASSQEIVKKRLDLSDDFIAWVWPDYLFNLQPAKSLRHTLISNNRSFSKSYESSSDYREHVKLANSLPEYSDLVTKWCR